LKILKFGLIIIGLLVGLFVLLVILALIFGDTETDPDPSRSASSNKVYDQPTPIPEPTVNSATLKPLPTTAPQPTVASTIPVPLTGEQIRALVDVARSLYTELQMFKNDPEFAQVGFGVCCRFNDWKLRARSFGDEMPQDATARFLGETGFLPGELLALGQAYVSLNAGSGDSGIIRNLETTIASGLGVSHTSAFGQKRIQGVVTVTDHRCRSLETYEKFYSRLDAGDYSAAAEVMDGPDCLEVVQNTQVAGPTETADVVELGGQIIQYHLYALPDGTEIWFREDEVERE